MALAPTLALLFVGRVISGATAASISTAGAYIADVEPPERRARGFGLISIAFGVGFVLGPALGGLLGAIAPRLPFWAAAALSLLNAGGGALVLPESLPPERRAAFAWRRANPLGALALLRARPGLPALAGLSFLGFLARTSLPAVFVLQAGYRYGWGRRRSASPSPRSASARRRSAACWCSRCCTRWASGARCCSASRAAPPDSPISRSRRPAARSGPASR